MIRKIQRLSILFILLGCQMAYGQVTDLFEVRSPQSADMLRYGNVPISKNSGRLNLDIDLLSVEDRDFNLPISIRYNSAGYIPSKAEGLVGLDWTLIAGGGIYREVRDVPDDWDAEPGIGNNVRKGFLHIIKDGVNLNKELIYNNPTQYMDILPANLHLKNSKIEPSSDVYNFTFGPYSGKFTINFDGSTNVLSTSGGKFKVDLSGYNYYYHGSYTSVIKIITDNGYIYSFGGTKDAMEYTINYQNSGVYNTQINISSFHLYEIEAPNGRKLEIIYSSVGDSHMHITNVLGAIGSRREYLKNYTLSSCPVRFILKNAYSKMTDSYKVYSYTMPEFIDAHMLTKVALISEIKTDAQILKFHYTSRPNVLYDPQMLGEFPTNCGAKLDSICLQQNGATVKRVRFNYTTYGQKSRFFLNKVTLSNGGAYTFDYNHSYTFPVPRSKDVDYWGFWRNTGRDVATGVIEPDFYNSIDYISDKAQTESAIAGYDHALLSQITYPTGGSTEIVYERHQYARKIDIDTNGNYSPYVSTWSKDLYAGGARVKCLKDKTDDKTTIKQFIYKNIPSDSQSRSSGIISNYPRYADMYHIPIAGSNAHSLAGDTPSLSTEHGINFQSKYMDHISYSKVTEVMQDGESQQGPHTITEFTDYITHPDNFLDDKLLAYTDYSYSTFAKNSIRDVQRRNNERGQIRKEEYYSSAGVLKKKDEYTYRSDNARFNTNFGIYGRVMYGLLFQLSKEYFYPFSLKSKTTTEYFSGGGNISTTTDYTYNADGYLKESTMLNSTGKSISKKLYYPFDISSSVHQAMINRNMLSATVREEEYVGGTMTKQTRKNYILNGALPVLGNIEDGMPQTPKEIVGYADYDLKGKPRTIIYNNGTKIALLWGYSGQHIVARVEGVAYSDINGTLTESFINGIASSNTFTATQNTEIRNKLNTQNVLITTYTYLPLTGVQTVTDPSGKIVNYNYDSFGRLSEVFIRKGDSKEVLKSYIYKFKNE